MEKENRQSSNAAHLYGEVYGNVFMNDTKNGKVIDFTVDTFESYAKDGETKYDHVQTKVKFFTSDEKTIAAFEQIAKDQKANAENSNVEGYERTRHNVSVDGHVKSDQYENKEGETQYKRYVAASAVAIDAEKQENEVRNSAILDGNISSVKVFEEEKDKTPYAVVGVATHWYYKDAENQTKSETSFHNVIVNQKRNQEFFDLLKKEDAVGTRVQVNCRLADSLYLRRVKVFEKKEKKSEAQAQEVKAEPKAEKKTAAKKTEKAAKEEKKAPAKKPVSRKKSGVTLK